MITKKRPLCRLLALLLCLGLLSGCGGEGGAPNSPSRNVESPTQSAGPSDPPEETRPEPTQEPEVEDDSWKDVLRSIPYCGDVENCAMTADQALAYAQLLADGIAGKVSEGSCYDIAADFGAMAYWDTPFTVWEYQIDRANAILGDFAGDGQPYICVLNSDHPECGFDVYYSDGGAVDYVYGGETGGHVYITFGLDTDGKMTISCEGVTGSSHSIEWLILSGGETKTVHSLVELGDYEPPHPVHVIVDGEESVYTHEEYENLNPPTNQWDLPDTPYTPIPLRDMITYLNEYAAAKGSSRAVTVEERSE